MCVRLSVSHALEGCIYICVCVIDEDTTAWVTKGLKGYVNHSPSLLNSIGFDAEAEVRE